MNPYNWVCASNENLFPLLLNLQRQSCNSFSCTNWSFSSWLIFDLYLLHHHWCLTEKTFMHWKKNYSQEFCSLFSYCLQICFILFWAHTLSFWNQGKCRRINSANLCMWQAYQRIINFWCWWHQADFCKSDIVIFKYSPISYKQYIALSFLKLQLMCMLSISRFWIFVAVLLQ